MLELARKARYDDTDVIAAVGGDGTVNLVARELYGSDKIMAIIPDGSGNGLARHLGITPKTSQAIRVINTMNVQRIDTAAVNGVFFVSIAGIGFDAFVAKLYKTSSMRGIFPYIRIITSRYPSYKPRTYTLILDGKELTTEALFITFANSGQFGYNTAIAPSADASDGLFEVCIFQKVPLLKLPMVLHALFRKEIQNTGYSRIIQASSIVVKNRSKRYVNVDGEPVRMKKRLKININPLSLRIILPLASSRQV
jgi:YegS/Rv2252/BmrU family lipid kinase